MTSTLAQQTFTDLAFLNPLIDSVGLQKAVPAIAKDPVLIKRIGTVLDKTV